MESKRQIDQRRITRNAGILASRRSPAHHYGIAHKAAVVTDALVVTLIALLNVTAKRGCSAQLDRLHDAKLSGGQRRSMVLTISLPVAAEHIRHFQA
jgi:hypothetical protein